MSKTIKKGENGQFLLTLEAYATGSTTTTTSTKPVDIVLVLDVSGSMKENLTEAGYRYNEVYDLSTNGTYYYKNSSNGQYQRAYYCDGENGAEILTTTLAGTHGTTRVWGNCWGESGTRLIPKTSSADTTGTQFYVQEYVAAVTKMNALKSAVKGFVNSVSAKSPESNIAIVKFGAEINNEIGNDFNGSGWNYTQTVKGLTLHQALRNSTRRLMPFSMAAYTRPPGPAAGQGDYREGSQHGPSEGVSPVHRW